MYFINSVATKLRWDLHKRILQLAIPMILANITTPLIGLVDTAVLGHMTQVHYLAGAAIGAFVLTQLYWICGFVRMTTTGLSAQAKGRDKLAASPAVHSTQLLQQSLLLSGVIGLVILLCQPIILSLGLMASAAEPPVAQSIRDYFTVRVWGAPFAVMNMALIGWLIGQQKAKQVMYLQIIINLLNVLLNLFFVYGLEWQVKGVATASVISEMIGFTMGMSIALSCIRVKLAMFFNASFKGLGKLMRLNGHMFVRNLALQLCLAFITFQGARFGETTAALNAILMQFFVLIALGLDGIAYAVEALLGEAKGAKKPRVLIKWVRLGLIWSSVFAIGYALLFWAAGEQILLLLTDKASLLDAFRDYSFIVILLPFIGHWCFLFDAVFIGLTRAKAMQNSMILSGLIFFASWAIWGSLENQGLWYAMLAFLAARGITLGGYFVYLAKTSRLLD